MIRALMNEQNIRLYIEKRGQYRFLEFIHLVEGNLAVAENKSNADTHAAHDLANSAGKLK